MAQTERKNGLCHWCGGAVGDRVWKDGRKIYCSSDCHSAGLLPVFMFTTIVLTAILVLSFLFPEFFLLMASHYNDSWIIVYGLYAAFAGVDLLSGYTWYKGWKARNEIIRHKDTQ